MLERLTAFFSNPAGYHTPLPEADAQHALGALLVRAAKADNTYLVEEIAQIDQVLCERHGLNPVEAAKMRAECEVLEKAMPNTADIAAVLEHAISVAEKEATLTALWRVVYADGINKEVEDRLLHEIEAVLGVRADRAKALQDAAHG